MKKIETTPAFERCVKKLTKKHFDVDLLKEAIKMLASTRFELIPKRYNAHYLSGQLAGKAEIHIGGRNSDWLLVFTETDDAIRLIFTGTDQHIQTLKFYIESSPEHNKSMPAEKCSYF